MRNGQQNNKRMRGRNHNNNNNNNNNHRKNHNPMSRVYESNGPDVKIRGNPSHIAEKYIQLARDAQASGDPVSAENYYQHAEHYYRLIASAQETFRQNNPHLPRQENDVPSARDDTFDDGDEDMGQNSSAMGIDTPFGTREPQPFLPRDPQPYQQQAPRSNQPVSNDSGDEVERLPSFITGGQQPQGQQPNPNQQNGANGHEGNQPDRFLLHRRRRRHRSNPRPDFQGNGQPSTGGGEDRDDPSPRNE